MSCRDVPLILLWRAAPLSTIVLPEILASAGATVDAVPAGANGLRLKRDWSGV